MGNRVDGPIDYVVDGGTIRTAYGTLIREESGFTAAFQWAIRQEGEVTQVPSGRHVVNDSLEVAAGVTVIGSGDGVIGTLLDFDRKCNRLWTSSVRPGAFMTWTSDKGVRDGLAFIRCKAVNTADA